MKNINPSHAPFSFSNSISIFLFKIAVSPCNRLIFLLDILDLQIRPNQGLQGAPGGLKNGLIEMRKQTRSITGAKE
ncbi:MAG: hypothetical protein GY859_15510 [Desulfobacterales bacterium]|nr:hypothetical protein [Desulfobacterales bacterium]